MSGVKRTGRSGSRGVTGEGVLSPDTDLQNLRIMEPRILYDLRVEYELAGLLGDRESVLSRSTSLSGLAGERDGLAGKSTVQVEDAMTDT